MLIILEGADGGGKTTITQRLAADLAAALPGDTVEVLHKGPPRRHPLLEYEEPLYDYRPSTGRHVICDRWHVGEAVYPALLDRPTFADKPVLRHIEAFLRSRGAVLVHVQPPADVHLTRLATRGDDYLTIGQLPRARELFDEYVKTRNTLPELRLTGEVNALHVEEIITLARTHEGFAARVNPFITYVGPPNPCYLLLGDVRHQVARADAPGASRWLTGDPLDTLSMGPAFGPYRSTSGHYLLEYLPKSFWDAGVGLANACDVDNPIALLHALGNPPAVALGANAWRRLQSLGHGTGWQLGAAPHPQYVRRFLHNHGEAYGRVVADALEFGKNLLGWRPE